MVAVLVLHGVIAAALITTGGRSPRTFLLAAVAPIVTSLWALSRIPAVTDGAVDVQNIGWVPALGLSLDLRLDGFGLVMVLLVALVGTAVFAYATAYFDERDGLGRFAGTLTAFAGAMVGLVLADDVIALYLFWELTSVTSYLLIGFEDERAAARSAALQAILVTGAGGLAMLGGFVLLAQEAGTRSLSAMVADPPGGTTTSVALALVLLGAFTKSAQAPFHFWLPAAMAAPTPVSAYLHSATMVKAGVYLVARLAPAFAAVALWRPAVLVIGVTTMLLGGYRALRQYDLKLLLAYGTVSQLGLLMVLFGAGTEATTEAGVVLLIAHAGFKATLFLVVGAIDHLAHTRDLRHLDGMGRRHPTLAGVGIVAAASMAGLPPLLGFLAKEEAYASLLDVTPGWGPLVLAGVVAGSVLTAAYSARFAWGAFRTRPAAVGSPLVGGDGPTATHPAAPLLVGPPLVLAATAVVLGPAAGLLDPLVSAASSALLGEAVEIHLSLWHGLNTALALSALTVAVAAALFVARDRVEAAQGRRRPVPEAAEGYRRAVSGLNHLADRVTGVAQNGSLPVYLTTILATLLLVPGAALLRAWTAPDDLVLADSPLQLVAVLAVAVTAVAAALARRRLAAVLLLGGVGYGVAVLFLVQGAPDLALTQLLVETLALVIFVLVLRHLPDRFEAPSWRRRDLLRATVATGVGVFVTLAALATAAARRGDPVSVEQVARALPEAGGRNVVNVILVDFRGLDTLGEITVIAVAALGILTLIRPASRKDGDR